LTTKLAACHATCAELGRSPHVAPVTQYRKAVAAYEAAGREVGKCNVRCECAFDEIMEGTHPVAQAVSGLFWLHRTTVAEIEARAAAGQHGWGSTPREALVVYEAAVRTLSEAKDVLEVHVPATQLPAPQHPTPWRPRKTGYAYRAAEFQELTRRANKLAASDSDRLTRRAQHAVTWAHQAAVLTYEDAGLRAEALAFQQFAGNGVTDADQLEAAIAAVCAPAAAPR